jgi:serine/threonine protein kinase
MPRKSHRTQRRRRHKHRSTRHKLYRGGAYLASGTYGCVFGNPPLKCEGEAARRDNKFVTKLTDAFVVQEEITQAAPFTALDPQKQYFLGPSEGCKLDKADVKPGDEINKCSLYRSDPIHYNRLLILENGGTALESFKPKPQDYCALLESMSNVFDGIELAHRNQIAHCDIKPPNIVTLKRPNGTYHTRIIDFGLAKQLGSLDRNTDFDFYQTPYVFWPMETQFFGRGLDNHTPDMRQDILNHFYKNLKLYAKEAIPVKSYFTADEESGFNEAGLNQAVGNINFRDLRQAFIWLDTYSLGMTLALVYHRLIPHAVKLKSDGSQYVQIPVKLYLADHADSLQWHKDVDEHITRPLSKLVYDMIHIVPGRRPTILQAKARYEALFPEMRRLLTKKQIQKHLKLTGSLGETPTPPTPTPVLPPIPEGNSNSSGSSVNLDSSSGSSVELSP